MYLASHESKENHRVMEEKSMEDFVESFAAQPMSHYELDKQRGERNPISIYSSS